MPQESILIMNLLPYSQTYQAYRLLFFLKCIKTLRLTVSFSTAQDLINLLPHDSINIHSNFIELLRPNGTWAIQTAFLSGLLLSFSRETSPLFFSSVTILDDSGTTLIMSLFFSFFQFFPMFFLV